ncbi:MAG TPA: hypothetical protein VGK46_03340 [Saprospiraceae bacterium]
MVQTHLYARFEETRVFSIPAENGEPLCTVGKGDWLGVLVLQGDWAHVIATACEGWVKISETESRPPFHLHIQQSEGKAISYVNSPAKMSS